MPFLVEAPLADPVVEETFRRLFAARRRNGETRPGKTAALEQDWRTWLAALFPPYTSDAFGRPIPFAAQHADFWEWVWAIQRTARPRPFVAIWPRGGAKSTNAEMACVAVAARLTRRYGLYICETQEQADDHVGNVGAMLESAAVARHYPELASRLLGKFGHSRGWRRNRLRTAAGFTIDAIGLDSAARGAKVDEDRPDFLIFDDIDGERDTEATTEKKVATMTRRLLPAGAPDVAVLAVQNLVHPDSVFSRLADGRADFLADRIVSGPHPAIEGLAYEEHAGRHVITGGVPTWVGMDLERCQKMLDDMGLIAFLAECQHETSVLLQRVFRGEWWAEGRNRYDAADPRHVNRCVARFLSFDTAYKDEEQHDATSYGVYELWPDYRLAVREVWWDKVESADLPELIEQTAARHNADEKLMAVLVEDKGSGISALQELRGLRAGAPAWLRPLLVPYLPQDSKEYRARQAARWCLRDCILLPEPCEAVPWLLPLERMLYRFPNTPLKDPIDQFSQMVLWLDSAASPKGHSILEEGWRLRVAAAEARAQRPEQEREEAA